MELCQFLGVVWKVKDFNDEFRSLDKAPKMWGGTVKCDLGYCWWAVFFWQFIHYWEGFIHPRWCRISSINSIVEDVDGRIFISWDSPFRRQIKKNMMEYDSEILCVPLNCCRIFLLASVFLSSRRILSCGIWGISRLTLQMVSSNTIFWLLCQWNPKTGFATFWVRPKNHKLRCSLLGTLSISCQDGSGVLEPVEYGP